MVERKALKQNDLQLEKIREEGREEIDVQTLAAYLNVSVSKIEDIKRRLANNNGHLAIMVHPFYEQYFVEMYPSFIKRIKVDYLAGEFVETLAENETKNLKAMPLLVLEEHDNIQKTQEKLGGNVAVVRTVDAQGRPWLTPSSENPTTEEMEESREIFLNIMFSLGVKSVLLGGLFRFTCVQQMEKLLEQNGFLVDVTKYSFGPSSTPGRAKKSTGKVE